MRGLEPRTHSTRSKEYMHFIIDSISLGLGGKGRAVHFAGSHVFVFFYITCMVRFAPLSHL